MASESVTVKREMIAPRLHNNLARGDISAEMT